MMVMRSPPGDQARVSGARISDGTGTKLDYRSTLLDFFFSKREEFQGERDKRLSERQREVERGSFGGNVEGE